MFDRIFRRLSGRSGKSKLSRAMKRVAEEDTPKTRRSLYRQLLESSLLLPKPGEADDPELGRAVVLKADMDLEIMTVKGPQGQPIMVAFTDPGALLAWQPGGTKYVGLRAQDAFSLAVSNDMAGIVINPAGPVGGELSRIELLALAEGGIPQPGHEQHPSVTGISLSEGARAYVGPPSMDIPKTTVANLGEALAEYPEIFSAYLYETVISGGERHLAIGLQFDSPPNPQRRSEIIAGIAQRTGPLLSQHAFVDLVILDQPELTAVVQSEGIPVLERQA